MHLSGLALLNPAIISSFNYFKEYQIYACLPLIVTGESGFNIYLTILIVFVLFFPKAGFIASLIPGYCFFIASKKQSLSPPFGGERFFSFRDEMRLISFKPDHRLYELYKLSVSTFICTGMKKYSMKNEHILIECPYLFKIGHCVVVLNGNTLKFVVCPYMNQKFEQPLLKINSTGIILSTIFLFCRPHMNPILTVKS
jgi:hypothetical protein